MKTSTERIIELECEIIVLRQAIMLADGCRDRTQTTEEHLEWHISRAREVIQRAERLYLALHPNYPPLQPLRVEGVTDDAE